MTNKDSIGTINHEGLVVENTGNAVIISIISSSGCSGCQAEGSCSLSGKEEKMIEVHGKYNVKPGDSVIILMKQSLGYAALFLGYILPVIIVITVLIALVLSKIPELTAGLISIAILIPYYSILYLFRKRINEKFTFTLKM